MRWICTVAFDDYCVGDIYEVLPRYDEKDSVWLVGVKQADEDPDYIGKACPFHDFVNSFEPVD